MEREKHVTHLDKMAEKYFALYTEGVEKPLGSLKTEAMAEEVIRDLSAEFDRKFYVEQVTKEQAEQIRVDITRPSESLRNLIDKVVKKIE